MEQLAFASEKVSMDFEKVNLATDCSLTQLSVIDLDSAQAPDSSIFEITTSQDGSKLTLSVRDSLSDATAGNYTLSVIETNINNPLDTLAKKINVSILSPC